MSYIITNLLKTKFIIYLMLDESLDFLSHYYQYILLRYSFYRNIFSMLRRIFSSHLFRTCLARVVKKDLR